MAALCALSLAVPEVLIVESTAVTVKSETTFVDLRNARAAKQAIMPDDKTPHAKVEVGDALAQELYTAGRVSPIVWSLTDPIFRAAVNDGLIRNPSDNPSMKQVRAAQRKLKIDLVLFITAYQDGDQLHAAAELYKGDKPIWKDQKDMSVTLSGHFDQDGAIKSLARTWAQILGQDPFKPYAPSPERQTPEPDPGSVPKPADVQTPLAPKASDNKSLFAEADRLLKNGEGSKGVGLLRDAVDAAPDDIERRQGLAEYLLKVHKPELAATEARRACQTAPNNLALRMLAARAWMEAGRPDEAQSDLNEVVARDPEGAGARELLGEAALWQLKAPAAIDHFDAAIKDKPTPELYLYRSLARAVGGDSAASGDDLAQVKGLDEEGTDARYTFSVLILDKAFSQITDELKPLYQAAVSKPGKDVSDGADYQSKRLSALVAIFQALPIPKSHAKSNDRRILALNLLNESISDVGAYIDAPNDDTMSDARINLGEAMKQMAAAQDEYKSEQEQSSGERVG